MKAKQQNPAATQQARVFPGITCSRDAGRLSPRGFQRTRNDILRPGTGEPRGAETGEVAAASRAIRFIASAHNFASAASVA